jgi:hypothetical protein
VRGLALLLLVATTAACDESRKPPPPSEGLAAPAASDLADLGVDAAGIFELTDPPAPAGDLKAEIERFVNVDTCVAERAKLDPLVGDALRAIGYDTFLRDACRLLEAAKDRKRETCDRIDSSALRSRCQSWVAILGQTPDGCPLKFEAFPERGRDASCVAIAGRDPRLCAGEGRAAPRGTCEALATRDASKCEQLLASDRPACKREVSRWQPLLSAPLEGLPKLPAVRARMTLAGEGPTPNPGTPEVDLAADFARGAVVVTLRDRARVELGSLGESEGMRFAPSPNKRPRAGLAVILEPPALGSKEPPKPVLQKLEIEIPGEATLVHPGATCDCKVTTARVDKTRGGEIAIVVEGTIALGTRAYKMKIDVATFVRDVVTEQPGSRTLPPLHPLLGRDGGR